MTDKEKFAGLKEMQIAENEAQYGVELRETFGSESIEAANARFMGMSEESYASAGELEKKIKEILKQALAQGDVKGALSAEVFALHKQWISMYWDKYHPEAHMGLADMYVGDPRFTKYYDEIAAGAAAFLRDVIYAHCEKSEI